MNFKKIILYKEPAISEINIEKLTKFLEDNFPFEVKIKENIFKEFSLKNIKELSDGKPPSPLRKGTTQKQTRSLEKRKKTDENIFFVEKY